MADGNQVLPFMVPVIDGKIRIEKARTLDWDETVAFGIALEELIDAQHEAADQRKALTEGTPKK